MTARAEIKARLVSALRARAELQDEALQVHRKGVVGVSSLACDEPRCTGEAHRYAAQLLRNLAFEIEGWL